MRHELPQVGMDCRVCLLGFLLHLLCYVLSRAAAVTRCTAATVWGACTSIALIASSPQCSYYVDFKGDSPYVVQEGEDPGLKGKLQLLKVTCRACVCLPAAWLVGPAAAAQGGPRKAVPTQAGSCRQWLTACGSLLAAR